jgi:hypothetical protein
MRRRLGLVLTASALLGLAASDARAQAAGTGATVPTFLITGFIDQLVTYSNNTSNYDNDLHRKDYLFYGRTRGRFDIVGEYGKAKGVLGLELDLVYGQTGTGNTNIATVQGGAVTAPTGAVNVWPTGTDGSFSLNTDVRGVLELKWLYTEFEVPYIPYPTIARLGAQPFATAASYKLAAYANGDFAGVNLVSTISRNVKLVGTYVAVEEMLVGRQQGTASNTFLGVSPLQLRGDDWALIFAPEITPIKGLDLKPMYSYFTASGTTSFAARQPRGGIGNVTWFQTICGPGPGVPAPGSPAWQNGPDCVGNNTGGSWRKGIIENRHTVGLDMRYRNGPFSLDPTVYYQFGNRSLIAPAASSGALPVQFLDAGVTPGHKYYSNLSAWFVDIRTGYELGPVLLEAMGMFTTGNAARDTTLRTVKYYQPLDTDTSYLADWGGQLTALGVDYLDAMLEGAGIPPGTTIGWDKYGRIQLGARATYAVTPTLSLYGGWNGHWTPHAIQKNALFPGGGTIVPLFTGQEAKSASNYIGNEIFAGLTWRFAPGIALDSAGGYMWTGPALDAFTNAVQGAREARNVYLLSSRIRFSF